MLETEPLMPKMVRRFVLLGRPISILWSWELQAYIPAADLAAIVGVDPGLLLGYAHSTAMEMEWGRFELVDQPDGVICVRLSAVPCLLTALALQIRDQDPPNQLLFWIAQDAMGALAERWQMGDAEDLARRRRDTLIQVAGMFNHYKHDLDMVDGLYGLSAEE